MTHPSTPFSHMQHAVDIVSSSPHPDNKIAATLFGQNWAISRTNEWPDIIASRIGMEERIGNSSGTVHAETNCILNAPAATLGSSLCITDPFCPNCAKNIVEAGVTAIYIDHKGFDKDFFMRRSGHFTTMSMKICEKAGVNVYELNRREEKIIPIFESGPGYTPAEDSPIAIETINAVNDAMLRQLVGKAARMHQRRKFAIALTRDTKGDLFALTARGHAVIGFTMQDGRDEEAVLSPETKYSYMQEPVNRLLMAMARRGLKLCDGYFYCSQVPTSREQVNLVAAGIRRITIGDVARARDPMRAKP
jgi:deoxycytidylate deaminase